MQMQQHFHQPTFPMSLFMIDREFDRFETNRDLEMQLREAEPANFYHDTCNPEE